MDSISNAFNTVWNWDPGIFPTMQETLSNPWGALWVNPAPKSNAISPLMLVALGVGGFLLWRAIK